MDGDGVISSTPFRTRSLITMANDTPPFSPPTPTAEHTAFDGLIQKVAWRWQSRGRVSQGRATVVSTASHSINNSRTSRGIHSRNSQKAVGYNIVNIPRLLLLCTNIDDGWPLPCATRQSMFQDHSFSPFFLFLIIERTCSFLPLTLLNHIAVRDALTAGRRRTGDDPEKI